MSLRVQILAAIAARLGQDRKIYRSRTAMLAARQLPAVVIEPQADEVTTRRVGGPTDRQLTIDIVCYAAGAVPDAEIEPMVASINAALAELPWRPTGVMSVAERGITWDYDDVEMVRAPISYSLGYRE